MRLTQLAIVPPLLVAFATSCGHDEEKTLDIKKANLELRAVADPASDCGVGDKIAQSLQEEDNESGMEEDTLWSVSDMFNENDKRFAFDIVLDLSKTGVDVQRTDIFQTEVSISPGSAFEGTGAPPSTKLVLSKRTPRVNETSDAVGVSKLCQRAFIAYNSPGSFELSARSFDAVAHLAVVVTPNETKTPSPEVVKWDLTIQEKFDSQSSSSQIIPVSVTVLQSDGSPMSKETPVTWAATQPGVIESAATPTNDNGVASNKLIIPGNLSSDRDDPFASRPIVLSATAGSVTTRLVISPD